MTPSEMAVDVQFADEQEIREAIEVLLGEIGLSLDALIEEGINGSFSSDASRMAWWAVSPFVESDS
jgi:hypothetical protein